MNLIWRLNQKFDDIREPERFLAFFFCIALPWSLLTIISFSLFVVTGAALIGMRWWWLNKVKR